MRNTLFIEIKNESFHRERNKQQNRRRKKNYDDRHRRPHGEIVVIENSMDIFNLKNAKKQITSILCELY